MDRIWQWAWDRYKVRYSWALCAVIFAVFLPAFLMLSFIVVAFEKSDRYVEAGAVTVVGLPIGDTVNIAARVEQLTKTTGDPILLTGQTVNALASRPDALIDRGFHALKGKSVAVQVFSLDSRADALSG